jgi:methyl-accepting chemotaxis protein
VGLRQRLYLQFGVAILPLMALVVYQALARSDLPARVNVALRAYDVSLDAVNGFGKFMDGVADAVDTGRVGSNSIAALQRARTDERVLAESFAEDADLAKRLDAIVAAIPANAGINAVMPLKAELQSLRVAIGDSAERRRHALSALVQEEQQNERRRGELMLAGGLAALLVLGLTVWLLRRLVRGITDPIARSVDAANAIAQGRLERPVAAPQGRRDEMAQLLMAMADMHSKLTAIVRSVRTRSESVAAASDALSGETAALSQRSEEQAASLEEAAASMEELSTTVRENATHARRANDLARQAAGAAEAGSNAVRRVVETMELIAASSRRISDIVGVIDSIAFQTNILALNAAVEAARAGEQGRGFAVVASEVRSLSQRCAAAATEIKELIGTSVAQVADGSTRVGEAGRSIDVLVKDVHEVSELMAQIAAATVEQERGISQVATSVTQMDGVVQRNASAAQEVAVTSERLQHDAQGLEDAVRHFTVAAETGRPAAPDVAAPQPRLAAPRALHKIG